jgi:uncharacterized protein with ATP-grasp and redox domains
MKLEDVKKILDKVCKEENGWIKENETEDTNILYSKPLLSDSVSYDQKYITIEIIQEEDWEGDEEIFVPEEECSKPFYTPKILGCTDNLGDNIVDGPF